LRTGRYSAYVIKQILENAMGSFKGDHGSVRGRPVFQDAPLRA